MNHDKTVEEARKRECPLYTVAMIISLYEKGWYPEGNEVLACKGDNCMMWRWDQDRYGALRGYCGLAGRIG